MKIKKVVREQFLDDQIMLDAFDKCLKDGISIVFNGWSRDGKTNAGPYIINPEEIIEYSEINRIHKRVKKIGACLHYNAGDSCSNKIIDAHSIQRTGQLLNIAEKGHVYTISRDANEFRKNKGKVTYKLIGLNKISTFRGFCSYHDSVLFKEIDKKYLIPTTEQILLYAYRSICREIYAKSYVIEKMISIRETAKSQAATDDLFDSVIIGNSNGLQNLLRHKKMFDETLQLSKYDDIKYVLYVFEDKQNLAFSSLLFPHFDFNGRILQDIGNLNIELELLTFCSAPLKNGWGYLLAWHDSSSNTAKKMIDSLNNGKKETTIIDCLFRLALNAENIAISPSWWESINNEEKEQILNVVSNALDIFADIENNYLSNGVSGIVDWQYCNVLSNQ